MNSKFLRKLVKCFGFLTETLPEEYQPAARAFLFSLTNETPDCERPVPQEIWPTLAYAVSRAAKKSRFYKKAKFVLDTHTEPVLVQKWDYPRYRGRTMEGYGITHPHYFVLGGFTAYPQGGGLWLVEDRYDWHVPDRWRVPDVVTHHIPEWVLSKFCERGEDGWYISEVGTLDKWSTPYWHRSYIRLSDYLDPQWFE
jgi:hypothetical protein